MSEREKNQERSIEEILAIVGRRIQPVLSGDKRRVVIFEDGGEDLLVELFLASGSIIVAEREMAREVIKELAEKLGADLTKYGELVSSTNLIDPREKMISVSRYPTKIKDIVITAEDIGHWDAGYYWTRTWAVENLHPKSRLQKVGEKVRGALGFGDDQFFQP